MESGVRVPQQKRSIEKRNAVVRAGWELFCEKGYYQTNTAEIAKHAGVSTGIVYHYFQDKKAILKEVVALYTAGLEERMLELLDLPSDKDGLKESLERMIDAAAASHTMDRAAHDEFMALALLDDEIRSLFDSFEERILESMGIKLRKAGLQVQSLPIRLRICYGIVEDVCHAYVNGRISPEEFPTARTLAAAAMTRLLDESDDRRERS